tara:strand:- start:756 stop:3848 length:3093 start_codon:yes stop_codon:yes gene_type:complete
MSDILDDIDAYNIQRYSRDFEGGAFFQTRGYEFPPYERQWLSRNGNKKIEGITIYRFPISNAIEQVMNLISLGEWYKIKDRYNFDTMFHLGLVCEFDDGFVVIDKQQSLNIIPNGQLPHTAQFMELALPENREYTFDQMFRGAVHLLGRERFYKYDAFKSNCQQFCLALLQAINMDSREATDFVYQDISGVIRDMPQYTQRIARALTDYAGMKDMKGSVGINYKRDDTLDNLADNVASGFGDDLEEGGGLNKLNAKMRPVREKWVVENMKKDGVNDTPAQREKYMYKWQGIYKNDGKEREHHLYFEGEMDYSKGLTYQNVFGAQEHFYPVDKTKLTPRYRNERDWQNGQISEPHKMRYYASNVNLFPNKFDTFGTDYPDPVITKQEAEDSFKKLQAVNVDTPNMTQSNVGNDATDYFTAEFRRRVEMESGSQISQLDAWNSKEHHAGIIAHMYMLNRKSIWTQAYVELANDLVSNPNLPNYYYSEDKKKIKIGKKTKTETIIQKNLPTFKEINDMMENDKELKLVYFFKIFFSKWACNSVSCRSHLKGAIQSHIGSNNQFKPYVAKWLYNKFKDSIGENGTILDFSSGWGGRLAGAMALNMNYIGNDFNAKLMKPYSQMVKMFKKEGSTSIVSMTNKDAGAVKWSEKKYDFFFTSPPYEKGGKQVEKYEGMKEYNQDSFYNTLLIPAISEVLKGLPMNKWFCLNTPQGNYNQLVARFLPEADWKTLYITAKRAGQSTKEKKQDKLDNQEYIYCWQKTAKLMESLKDPVEYQQGQEIEKTKERKKAVVKQVQKAFTPKGRLRAPFKLKETIKSSDIDEKSKKNLLEALELGGHAQMNIISQTLRELEKKEHNKRFTGRKAKENKADNFYNTPVREAPEGIINLLPTEKAPRETKREKMRFPSEFEKKATRIGEDKREIPLSQRRAMGYRTAGDLKREREYNVGFDPKRLSEIEERGEPPEESRKAVLSPLPKKIIETPLGEFPEAKDRFLIGEGFYPPVPAHYTTNFNNSNATEPPYNLPNVIYDIYSNGQ